MPKRILQGVVTSDKNDQTITVSVERRFKHPVLQKTIRKSKKYRAHDEKNSFKTKQINEICNFHSIKCEQINNINDALKYFRSHQQKIYLITGSLYLIGKIRKKLL